MNQSDTLPWHLKLVLSCFLLSPSNLVTYRDAKRFVEHTLCAVQGIAELYVFCPGAVSNSSQGPAHEEMPSQHSMRFND